MANAQSYPTKPVRFVIGFPAGGPNDILGRIIAQWLSTKLDQPFNVENKGGRSGNIATEEVVRAPADGYTIMLCGPANAISGSLYPNLSFNFLRDIVPVAGVTREALVMVVHPSVPAKTVPEFLAYAKANPGAMKMASTGSGSSPHITGELFKQMTGLQLDVVHYGGGGPALKAMIAGEAQMMFEPMSASIEPVRSGKLRAVAVTTATRSAALPDVPTFAESGFPKYTFASWFGIYAPARTPRVIVEKLNGELVKILQRQETRERFERLGIDTVGSTPEELAKHLRTEIAQYSATVRQHNIRGE